MTPAWAEELTASGGAAVAQQVDGADQGQAAAAGGQGTASDAGGAGVGASSTSSSSTPDSTVEAPSGGNEADGAADGASGSDVDAAGSNPGGAADVPSASDSNGAASIAGNGGDASGEGGATGTNADAQQEPQTSSDSTPGSNATAAANEDGSDTPQDDATPVSAYNAGAASTPIDESTSNGMVLDIKYPDGTQWNGEPVSSDTLLHGEINGSINEGILTVDKPNLSYTFPESISVPNTSGGKLYDGGILKATWHIDNGVFYITYGEEWLAKHPSGIKIGINFDFNIKPSLVQDGENVEVSFPGIAEPVSIPGKDGNVSGNKWGTVDEATQTVTWNIQLNVATTATDVTLTDTIGSNLTFAGATYKLDGADLAAAPSVNGQTATFKLGNLSKGQHTLTYTTLISPDAWKTVANGGQLSDVDNTASWTWGSKGDQSNEKNPAKSQAWLSTTMVGKSASGTPEDITWTAQLNTGSLKADMAGYVFTDTLGSGHAYMGSYEVKDASGATVATGELPADGSSFSYTFGEDAGKQAYTIVYHTKMTDTSSKDPVTNKDEVENPKGGPKGSNEGKFVPNDDTTYISKRLVSADTAATDGCATWESTIYTSRMSATTDVTKVSFTDKFGATNQWQQTQFDQIKLTAGGKELVEDTDYKITNKGEYSELAFELLASDTVKGLLGTTDIVVSYRTHCDGSNDTYKNTATIHTPTVSQDATAEYTISVEKVPAVAKDGSIAWDPNFDWGTVEAGSTGKGAWVANWTVYVNRDVINDWTHKPAGSLGGNDVVVTDELPQDMSYVPGSASYWLRPDKYNGIGALTTEPEIAGNSAMFTLKADASVGVKDGVNYFVQLTYKTVAHANAVGNTGAATQFTNSATAQSGSKSFPAGSKTVEASSKVVEKTAEQVANSSYIKYTIKVNETGLDLVAGSDTLTLTDTMDPKCTYLPATFHVYYHGTVNEVPGCSTLTENVTLESGTRATRLTVTIPDSTAVDVVYQVQPAGNPGDQVNLVNNVELSGVVNGIATHQKQWTVVKAGASTEGTGYGITIVKSDAADATKTLEGAEFELHQVGWDNTDTLIGTQTSDGNGQIQFGSKDEPLLACTLYYFVETKAPTGYQLSSDKTYFMFKGSYSQKAYQEALDKAKELGVADPSPATSFNITDKKNEAVPATGEFRLELAKTVNGEAPKGGETFKFSAAAEGDNAADAPELADVVTDADGKAAFATAKLSDKDAGKTYTYRIHEVTAAGEGWANAPDVIATVAVGMPTDNGDLAANVTYRQDAEQAEVYGDAAQFDNTYQAKPASAAIAVDKTVNGAKDSSIAKQFTFELKAASEGTPMPEGGATLTVDGTGTGSFGPISYAEPGDYHYVVHETTDEREGWRNDADVNVTVEVTLDDATRDLVAKVTYDRGTAGDSPAAAFDDTHIADGSAAIAVSKTVNGSATAKPDETFEFQLFRAGEDGAATGEQLGRTVSVKTGQTATFDALSYTADDAGKTFAYVVHEVGHADKGWVAHEDVAVTVSVAVDAATHQVVATVDYGQGKDAALFDDLYGASGSAVLSVAKTVNGEAPAEDARFQFRLEGADDASKAKLPAADTAETVGSAPASFGELEFGLEDAGKTFHFVISETTPATVGWTMAKPVSVKVTVGPDRGDGTLDACSVKYSRAAEGGSAALFDNAYEQASGEFQLAVVKTVNGEAPLSGEEFTFSAKAEGKNADDAPALGSVTTGKDGSAAFEPVALSDDDAGRTYTYRIHEETQAAKGWANAPDVVATVEVSGRGADNRLTASVTYKQDGAGAVPYEGAARFDNKHMATGSATIAVAKQVNGASPAADQKFDFALTANDEASEEKMPALTLVTTVGDLPASFGSIDFTLADAGKEFSYTIHETTLPAEGWTNAPDVTVTVAVGDDNDGDGKLPVTVEYSAVTADGSSALFNNFYQPVTPDQPDQPTTPDVPDQPDQPDQPATPDSPDQPTTPEQPSQPEQPTTLEQPGQPDQPAVPATPDKPSITKTSDETPVEGMALMGAAGTMLAVAGLCLGLRSRKRGGRR